MTCQINTEMKIGKMLWGISVLIFSTQFSKNLFPYAMKLIVAVFSEVWPSPGIKCEPEYKGRHCRVQNVDNRPRNQRENGHTEAAAI